MWLLILKEVFFFQYHHMSSQTSWLSGVLSLLLLLPRFGSHWKFGLVSVFSTKIKQTGSCYNMSRLLFNSTVLKMSINGIKPQNTNVIYLCIYYIVTTHPYVFRPVYVVIISRKAFLSPCDMYVHRGKLFVFYTYKITVLCKAKITMSHLISCCIKQYLHGIYRNNYWT
jgi:hypothetical protein